MGGDIYVSSSVSLRGDIADQISYVEGVDSATPIAYQNIEFLNPNNDLEQLTFMAIDPATYSRVTNFIFSDNAVNGPSALARLK